MVPEEAVRAAIDSLVAWQPVTNACSQLWPDEAIEAARGLPVEPGGPLHGVPVLVKDLYDVAGHETTGCSAAFRGNVAASDAPLVTALRAAGAVIVGKANMHELAAGGTNHVSACGRTRNPWDPERITGGSSGGSAAAVAQRSVPLSLGSDTGGSIRIPSSLCGVTGLKPTHGRLPLDGVMPLAPSLDCPGPIAATAEGAALAFAVLAGEAHEPAPASAYRVGVVAEGFFAERMTTAVRGALEEAGRTLGAAGAVVVEAALPGLEDGPHVWTDLAWPEFADTYPDLDLERLLPETAFLHWYGRRVTPAERADARRRRTKIRATFERALESVDAILLPATPFPAPRFDEEHVPVEGGGFGGVARPGERSARPRVASEPPKEGGDTLDLYQGGPGWFTRPVSLTGLPSLAFPVGFEENLGLPLGAQLVGRANGEWVLLDLARAFQAVTGHHLRAPAAPPPPGS
ncbi:MAG TPA: amidase [Actinomycetota bacterium]|nr:amidase [Actinomycetota bacterium]